LTWDAVITLGVDTTAENSVYTPVPTPDGKITETEDGYSISVTGEETAIDHDGAPADNVIELGGKTLHITQTEADNSAVRLSASSKSAFGLTIKGNLDVASSNGKIYSSDGIVFMNEENQQEGAIYLNVEGDMTLNATGMKINRNKYSDGSFGVGIADGSFKVGGKFNLTMSDISYRSGNESIFATLVGLMLGTGFTDEARNPSQYLFENDLNINKVEFVTNPDLPQNAPMNATGVCVNSLAYDFESYDHVHRDMVVKGNLAVKDVTVTADTADAEAYGLVATGQYASVTVEGATSITGIRATTQSGSSSYVAAVEASDGAKVNLKGNVTIGGEASQELKASGGGEEAYALVAYSGASIRINAPEDKDVEKTEDKIVYVKGDIQTADEGTEIIMNLCNESSVFEGYTVTPNAEGVQPGFTKIHLCNGASWIVPGENHLRGELNMGNDGHVRMPAPGESFTTLTVDKLAGEGGIFHMAVDTEQSKADQLVIGNGTGAHYLAFDNKAENAGKEDILVVTLQSGDASFLQANEVTVGNYSYTLRTDMLEDGSSLTYLTPTALSSSTLASLSMASLGAQCSAYLSSVSNLRSRMGEVRGRTGSGLWGQMHFWKDRADSYGGTSLSQDVMALSAGYDVMPNDKWIVGAGISAATHDQTGMECVGRVSGDADSFFIHPYGTWMHDNGMYVDIVGAVGVYDQDFHLYRPGQTGMSGSYTDFGVGVSVEVGRKYSQGMRNDADGKGSLGDEEGAHGWFVEPQAQLSFYAIFADDYKTSEGSFAKRDDATFLTGRIGVVAGKDFTFGDSKKGQVYAKAGFIHEFCGNQHVIFNGERFSEDSILGSRFYYGIGGEMELRGNLRAYGEIGREEGAHYTREYDARFGIKFSY